MINEQKILLVKKVKPYKNVLPGKLLSFFSKHNKFV